MKTKSNVLTLRVPRDLKDRIEKMADQQGVSINQLAMYAFAREITEMETRSYFQRVYGGKSPKKVKAGFDRVMSKVKSRKVPAWDRISVTNQPQATDGRRITNRPARNDA